MYLLAFFLLLLPATAQSLDAIEGNREITITINGRVDASPVNELERARNLYLSSLYAPLAPYVEQILDASALINKSAFQRKILRFLSLSSKAISSAAHGSFALSRPFFDNPQFADSYLSRPLHALNSWQALRRMPKIAALLANDAHVAKKLTRLPPHALKEIAQARIKTAALKIVISLAASYVCLMVTNNRDARIVYRSLLGTLLHRVLIDRGNTYPHLEAAVLKEIAKDKEREDAINVRDIVSEIKQTAAASGGKR